MTDTAANKADHEFPLRPELDASSAVPSMSCKADMWVKIDLSMDPASKNALIAWSTSDNYPTSTPPDGGCWLSVALYAQDELLAETPVKEPGGQWLTDKPFIPGLNARLFDWSCHSKELCLLCKTDPSR